MSKTSMSRAAPWLPRFEVAGLGKPNKPAVCQGCRKPLRNPWETGEDLCWQCGVDHELFHPETRWMGSSDKIQPTSTARRRPSWLRRLLANLLQARQVTALRSLPILMAVCSIFAGSLARADDCGDALIAEACACRSTVTSKEEPSLPSLRKGARKGEPREDGLDASVPRSASHHGMPNSTRSGSSISVSKRGSPRNDA
jgi:hypothetical protein